MKASAISFLMMLIASSTLLVVTAVDASDYTLEIFGNANMDDTIDEDDISYVEGVIDGTNEATELADANYDGRIDEDDIGQIELIIAGEEKELTIKDSAYADAPSRIVTVKKPVDRIVALNPYVPELIRSLDADKDKIVGICDNIAKEYEFFPEFSNLQNVGKSTNPDYEAILSLNPDLVIGYTRAAPEHAKTLSGVPVVAFDFYVAGNHIDETRKLGYILDKRSESEVYIDFYEGVLNTIRENVDEISEDDRPEVYWEMSEPYTSSGKGYSYDEKITTAGGNNIFGDIQYLWGSVDPEYVIERNPEIIVKQGSTSSNVGADIAELSDSRYEIINRPDLANVIAVENGKVYSIVSGFFGGLQGNFVGVAYLAKWFHPERFDDLDPRAIHNEYLTRFQGLPEDFLDTHGAFVYHPEVHPNGH
jgi:iron complex transport system substrate-binding protein